MPRIGSNFNQAEYLIDSRSAGTRVYLSQPVKNGTVQYIVGAPRYAVKVVPANYMAQRKPHNIRNEAMILSKLSHTNVNFSSTRLGCPK